MRLYEFANDDPLRVKLTAVASQLKSQYQDSETPLSTDEFMHILKQHGLPFGKPDLFDIVKQEPLKNIIANINDEKVTFVGDEQLDVDADQDESDKVVDQMAKKAMK